MGTERVRRSDRLRGEELRPQRQSERTRLVRLRPGHRAAHAFGHPPGRPDKARETWSIGDEAEPICAVAIGRLADGSLLDPDTAARDQAPRIRKELSEIVYEGAFGESAGFTG